MMFRPGVRAEYDGKVYDANDLRCPAAATILPAHDAGSAQPLGMAPHTFTVRTVRPTCDIHKYVLHTEQSTPTIVDAKTRQGRWANMCYDCWVLNGSTGALGTGQGQMILVPLTHAEDDLVNRGDIPCWGCGCDWTTGEHNLWLDHEPWCAYLGSLNLPEDES